jgi:hypothetical protein|nr:MAG TPA: ECF sigma factor [Caudoviricetes sp.]
MTNHDNQTVPQIYYRPLRKWIEVTLEEKQNWERFVNAIRKAKQRAGACCIPYKKSYKCDGLCEECEFRCIPKDAPQHLSIDGEMEITQKNGTRNSFLADDVITTVISIDSMILNRLLAELRDTDPESYQILMVLADGLSERAGAEKLNMPRNTFVYKKNQLLKRIRENF